MLQWTRIQLPLSGPLDQATDPKIIDPTQRVASLVNACYLKDGAISKAHGYDGITYTTPQDSPGVREGQALVRSMVSDGQRLYIGAIHNIDPDAGPPEYYAPDYFQAMCLGSNNVVAGVGPWAQLKIAQRIEYRTDAAISKVNTISAGGYLWTAWIEASAVYYQVSDEASGVVLKAKTELVAAALTASGVRVVAYGSRVAIFVAHSGNTITIFMFGVATPTAAPTSGVVTAARASPWDACYFYDGTVELAAVAWTDAAGDLHKAAFYTNAAAAYLYVEDATAVVWNSSPIACCYHYDDANNEHILAIAYQYDDHGTPTDIQIRTYDDDLVLDASGTVMTLATLGGTVDQLAISTEVGQSGVSMASLITVWIGSARDDSWAATLSRLYFDSLHCNTVLASHTGGYDANKIEVAMIGDSPPAGGVTISRAGTSFVIHFEPAVSTAALVEAAIAALAGADDLIDVLTPSTRVGALTRVDDSMSTTLMDMGLDASALTTYRVRPVKVYRYEAPGPLIGAYGTGAAWENYRISSRAVYHLQRSHCWLYSVSTEWPFALLATTGEYLSSLWQRVTEAIALQGTAAAPAAWHPGSCWIKTDAAGDESGSAVWMSAVRTAENDTLEIVSVEADFDTYGLRSASLGGLTMVGGGQLCTLDGRCMPHGFAHFPEVARTFRYSGPNAFGGLLEGAVYKYLTLYEWHDAKGIVHRGTPSLPIEVRTDLPAQLASRFTDVNVGNQNIDYRVITSDPYGVTSEGPEVSIALGIAAYASPQLMEVGINAALAAAAAPFRILAGLPITVGTATYNPHSTDHYEIALLDTVSAVKICFKSGTHGADGLNNCWAQLLGFDTTEDVKIGYMANIGWDVYEPLFAQGGSFLFKDPTETAKVVLHVRTLIAGDEVRNLNEVRIALFRTLADGDEYHLVGTYDNDTGAAWISISDTATDLSISEKRQPYTTGEPNDVLENAHPVGHILWAHGDRIWVVDNEDPRRVWVSKPVAVGVAPEFPYELQVIMPEPIVAGLSVGTHALLFSGRRCWAIAGDGPNALGVGDWLAPRLLSSDNGAVDYRGVCEIEGGAIVLGQRGLYAIQGGSVQPIGREVQDLLDGVEVLAIISRRDSREVWVFCQPPGADGYVVVYDYERKRWSKLTWGAAGSPSAAVEQEGLIYFGTATGSLRVEAQDWDYGGTAYAHQVETGWLKLAGLAGYQRVRRAHLIGTWIGTCTVAVEVFYDYEAAPAQTVSLPMLTAPAPDALARIVPTRQKCAAIKFRVTCTATAGAPEKRGVDLHAIELEIGTKGAFRRAQVSK